MRLIQYTNTNGSSSVGVVQGESILPVNKVASTYELARLAIEQQATLATAIAKLGTGKALSYATLIERRGLRVPLEHPDPAHLLVTGTGLTHLGSASTRDAMHQKMQGADETLTDSMRMFKWGLEGGRPAPGKAGTQPEWFFKGNGHSLVPPFGDFPVPAFAEDAGEEPEITGLYVCADDGTPYRVGFALGNEFSDHVMERRNYLYLAHSKLRYSSFGPELLIGPLPRSISGRSRVLSKGAVRWEKGFASGEDNMCHTLENLEFHHFKYEQFLAPGDVHVHFFGTATLSFADGVRVEQGDLFEISADAFGQPLVNGIRRVAPRLGAGAVKVL